MSALLPRGAGSDLRSRTVLSGVSTANKLWPVKYLIIYVIYMFFMLGTQWLIANHLAAARLAKGAAPMSSSVVLHAPPQDIGQQ
ncbi:MAG: hypothetical protein ABSG12_09240 [Steroidobacteraceae bacterium]